MEGALVLPVAVVLNRRRQRRIWRGGGVRLRRPAREPSRSGDRSRRRGSEPVLSRPSRDRGRQKLARTVRLPQPMGAGGRRPPEVTPRGWLRAAPVHRRVKAFTVKSRATRRRDPAARTVRPIGENRRPAKDAAQRRKRRAGVRGDRKVEPWTSPGRPGEQADQVPLFTERGPSFLQLVNIRNEHRGTVTFQFYACNVCREAPVCLTVTKQARPKQSFDTAF